MTRIDNDFFVGFSPEHSTDHEYTHGTTLQAQRSHAGWGCQDGLLSFSVEQRLFTPRVERQVHVQGERRNAGWLRLEVGCTDNRTDGSLAVAAAFGVVGPDAGGGSSQRFVHRLFGFREPQGWRNQVPTRFELSASLDRRWTILDYRDRIDAWAGGELQLGTIRSSVALSLGTTVSARTGSGEIGSSLGCVATLTGIGNDYLLTDVTRRRVVASGEINWTLRLHAVELLYGITARTRRYDEEPGGFVFGTLGVAVSIH